MITIQASITEFSGQARQQIADEYKTSPKTLRRWFKKYNIQVPPGNITPKYQKLIYETLGYPPKDE